MVGMVRFELATSACPAGMKANDLEEEIIDLWHYVCAFEVDVKGLACHKNRPCIKGCKHD